MLSNAKRIVIKVGSSIIIDEPTGSVRASWLSTFVADIAALKLQGKEIVLVTSGAVALGRAQLGMKAKAKLHLEEKQAAAACGQIILFSAWREAFTKEKIHIGQLLLTADDSIHRRRYLNARNTIDTLLECGAIPVINENDTVATAEIRFGDNDRLAARVAQMAGADLLILLSDIDGLYSADPSKDKNAKFIPEVKRITVDIEQMAGDPTSSVGSGGMITKLAAAKIATSAGCHMVIARGTLDHPVSLLMNGGKHTLFHAEGNPHNARKNWIAGSVHPAGSIVIDDGAVNALRSGKSLLPAGVVKVEGEFDRGDTVSLCDKSGALLAKGLIAYSSTDARLIMGKRSDEIEAILGFKRRDVLIHRDDMVLE